MSPKPKMQFFTCVCLAVLATLATVSLAEEQKPYIGVPPRSVNTRISNGEDAVPNAYPFVVSIQWGWSPWYPINHVCGGAILNSRWVITAAYCSYELHSYGDSYVVAGKQRLNVNEATQQRRTAVRRVDHPDWIGDFNPHDIALIQVDSPFVFDEFVAPINLPTFDFVHSGRGIVAGWGSTSTGFVENTSNVLQVASVPIVSTDLCYEHAAGLTGIVPPLDVNSLENVCTGIYGYSMISICARDSGSPLVQEVNGEWELIGTASWGIYPCGFPGAPSVYVRTSHYVDWINGIVSQ